MCSIIYVNIDIIQRQRIMLRVEDFSFFLTYKKQPSRIKGRIFLSFLTSKI